MMQLNKNQKKDVKNDEMVQIKRSDLEKIELELNQEKDKSKDYWDRLVRLQAEFDNARKRMQKQQGEFVKYANEGIVCELLIILDDLERSVEVQESKHQDPEVFLKGIEMILAHLYELLKKNKIKTIEAKGKIFDPNFHEALMQIEDDTLPENTVMEELQKGYMIEERIIRTTKVKVSKKTKK